MCGPGVQPENKHPTEAWDGIRNCRAGGPCVDQTSVGREEGGVVEPSRGRQSRSKALAGLWVWHIEGKTQEGTQKLRS